MPVISKILEFKADICLKQKQFRKYENLLTWAAKLSFFDSSAYEKKMYFLAINKVDGDKIIKMAKNLEKISNSYKIWFSLGYLNERKLNYDKAVFFYKKSALYSKHFYLPYERMLLIYLRENKPYNAVDVLEFALKFEHYLKFYRQLGEIYYKLKDKKAIKVFKYLTENIDSFSDNEIEKKKALKVSYFRLYNLLKKKDYLKKAESIKVKTYIDEELKKVSK
jgi:tetratricopeptide (TPR) repeat protein